MALRTTDILIPFPMRVSLNEVIQHPAWTEAKNAVAVAVETGGTVLVTGARGLGKSLLLKSLRHDLANASRDVLLVPGETETPGRPPDVLLLDDADRVPDRLLRQLTKKVRCAVLAGSPGLVEQARALDGQIRFVAMRALTDNEAADFVKAELRRVGLAEDILDPNDLTRLIRRSDGRPLALRTQASRALLTTRLDAADQERGTVGAHGASLVYDNPPAPMAEVLTADALELGPELRHQAEPPRVPLTSLSPPRVPTLARRVTRPAWKAAACIGILALTAVAMRQGLFSLHPPVRAPAKGVTIARAERPAASSPVAVLPKPIARSVLSPSPPEPKATAPETTLPLAVAAAKPSVEAPPIFFHVEPTPRSSQISSTIPSATFEIEPADDAKPGGKETLAASPIAPAVPANTVPAIAQSELTSASNTPSKVAAAAPEATRVAPSPRPAVAVLPRPSARPLHIVVAVRGRAAIALARGSIAVEALRGDGLAAVLDPVPATRHEPEISYFFPEDRSSALNLAHELASHTVPRLVASHGGLPRPGTIKVALPESRQAEESVTLTMSKRQ